MDTALTALVWGVTVIVYVVAGFAVLTIVISIVFALILVGIAIQEWWKEKKYVKKIREAKEAKYRPNEKEEGM